jgi:hypothetical protein
MTPTAKGGITSEFVARQTLFQAWESPRGSWSRFIGDVLPMQRQY